jgi:hypothetical protein
MKGSQEIASVNGAAEILAGFHTNACTFYGLLILAMFYGQWVQCDCTRFRRWPTDPRPTSTARESCRSRAPRDRGSPFSGGLDSGSKIEYPERVTTPERCPTCYRLLIDGSCDRGKCRQASKRKTTKQEREIERLVRARGKTRLTAERIITVQAEGGTGRARYHVPDGLEAMYPEGAAVSVPEGLTNAPI